MVRDRCNSTNRKDLPCGNGALAGSAYCFVHQERTTWVFGAVFSLVFCVVGILATMWISDAQRNAEQHRRIGEIEKHKPVVLFDLTEKGPDFLVLEITASARNVVPMRDLFLKFDIPGTLTQTAMLHSEGTAGCRLRSDLLAGGPMGTTAETVHGECRVLNPRGIYRAKLQINPTRPVARPGSEEVRRASQPRDYMPLMDLHDFARISFAWDFDGVSRHEVVYQDLEDLRYIKEDNKHLAEVMPKAYPDLSAVRQMEIKRQNW